MTDNINNYSRYYGRTDNDLRHSKSGVSFELINEAQSGLRWRVSFAVSVPFHWLSTKFEWTKTAALWVRICELVRLENDDHKRIWQELQHGQSDSDTLLLGTYHSVPHARGKSPHSFLRTPFCHDDSSSVIGRCFSLAPVCENSSCSKVENSVTIIGLR